ncbi:MAG: ATP-binding domain-containing protein, partial [Candidatus Cloacimonetes bacterium]|nr:ATP-binding domain-containing protein [Candidatus Cloacimonadota bacterium]
FYQRKEIKDILAYLHILDNPQDSESLLRVINFPPRGIGKNSLGQFLEYASKLDLSLYDSLKKFTKDEIINPILKKKFTRFTELIESWKSCAPELTVKELVTKILDKLELLRHYENSNDPKDIARNENIREFVAAIAEFSEAFERENADEPKLTDYLQNISLQTDMDNLDETESSVKLMTMHNAKGLEFDNVFIVGLEEGLLPHSRSLENKREFEEERRLLYVAITRAKKIVYLNYAKTRRTYETVNNTIPSRFLMEIDDKLLDKSFFLFDRYRPTGKILKQKKNVVLESQKHFKVGQKIAHNKFGEGIVLNVDGIGNDAKLTISFQNGNLKKIIGNFVRKI